MSDSVLPQASPPNHPPGSLEPDLTQSWHWPERSKPGMELSPSASRPATPEPRGESPEELPTETPRFVAIRSSVVALLSAGLAALTSFGFRLTESQAAALVAVATAILTLWALVRRGRKNG